MPCKLLLLGCGPGAAGAGAAAVTVGLASNSMFSTMNCACAACSAAVTAGGGGTGSSLVRASTLFISASPSCRNFCAGVPLGVPHAVASCVTLVPVCLPPVALLGLLVVEMAAVAADAGAAPTSVPGPAACSAL